MSKETIARIRKAEGSRNAKHKPSVKAWHEGEPYPDFPDDGKRHRVIRIVETYMNPKDGRPLETWEIEQLLERQAAVTTTPEPTRPEPEYQHVVEAGFVPEEPEVVVELRSWFRVSELAEADFTYYAADEDEYNLYAPNHTMRWQASGVCPQPEGAIVRYWPPRDDRDFKICLEVYRQAKEEAQHAKEND